MAKPIYQEILDSPGAKEALRNPRNAMTGRGFQSFYRFCKKCGEVFKTKQKRAKVCYFCNHSKNVCEDDFLFDEIKDLTRI